MPHLPVHTLPSMQGRSRGGLYGDVIETIDWSVGEIRAALAAAGMADNTLIIFSSDNGPWNNAPPRMLQEGIERWHTGSSGPLRGSKATTWEGGQRVPGIFCWPGQIAAGRVSPDLTTMPDVYPTLAAAAGAAVPDDIDGQNLLPFLKGEAAASPVQTFCYLMWETPEALRRGPWKLRLPVQSDASGAAPQPELYHLELDPSERYDRAAELPDTVARLMDELLHLRATLSGRRIAPATKPRRPQGCMTSTTRPSLLPLARPQAAIASSTGSRLSPAGVMAYSTRGGTSA
ncbi:MAG: hypothetical protein OHK0039_18440 [Bacteroidia bacterium]